jgi:hypothetical protein
VGIAGTSQPGCITLGGRPSPASGSAEDERAASSAPGDPLLTRPA